MKLVPLLPEDIIPKYALRLHADLQTFLQTTCLAQSTCCPRDGTTAGSRTSGRSLLARIQEIPYTYRLQYPTYIPRLLQIQRISPEERLATLTWDTSKIEPDRPIAAHPTCLLRADRRRIGCQLQYTDYCIGQLTSDARCQIVEHFRIARVSAIYLDGVSKNQTISLPYPLEIWLGLSNVWGID